MKWFSANFWTNILALVAILVTIIIDIINRINIIKDNEPLLSFELKDINDFLYLTVKNSGKTQAKNIRINIKKLHNNNNALDEDIIFTIPFELAPNEKVQGKISLYNESMINPTSFPYVDVTVSYNKNHFIKHVQYDRQVFFVASEELKVNAEQG